MQPPEEGIPSTQDVRNSCRVVRRIGPCDERTWKRFVSDYFPSARREKPESFTWEEYYDSLYNFTLENLYLLVQILEPGLVQTVFINNANLLRRSDLPFEIPTVYDPLVTESGILVIPVSRIRDDANPREFSDFVKLWANERDRIFSFYLRRNIKESQRLPSVFSSEEERNFDAYYGFAPRYLISRARLTPENVDILSEDSQPVDFNDPEQEAEIMEEEEILLQEMSEYVPEEEEEEETSPTEPSEERYSPRSSYSEDGDYYDDEEEY